MKCVFTNRVFGWMNSRCVTESPHRWKLENVPDDVAVWLPLPVGSDSRSFQEKPQQRSPSVVPSERLHQSAASSPKSPLLQQKVRGGLTWLQVLVTGQAEGTLGGHKSSSWNSSPDLQVCLFVMININTLIGERDG